MTILTWVLPQHFKIFQKKGKAWISVEQYHLWREHWTGFLCFPELLDSQALLPSHSRESLHEVGFKPVLKHTLQRGEGQVGASAVERGLRGTETALFQHTWWDKLWRCKGLEGALVPLDSCSIPELTHCLAIVFQKCLMMGKIIFQTKTELMPPLLLE